jgi:hypothetical protein
MPETRKNVAKFVPSFSQATSSGLEWPLPEMTLSKAFSNMLTVPGILPILSSPNKPILKVFKFEGSSILHGTPYVY